MTTLERSAERALTLWVPFLVLAAAFAFSLLGAGCDEIQGMGTDANFEPGPTCLAFCATAVDECDAIGVGTERCLQSCESDLAVAQETSNECGDAFQLGFECTAALSCDDFNAWLDRDPPEDYPCRPEVLEISDLCGEV